MHWPYQINCEVCCAGIKKKKFQDCPTSYGLGGTGSITQIEEMPILWSLKEGGGISLDVHLQQIHFYF